MGHHSSFDRDHQPMGTQPNSRMTNMMDDERVGHILDMLEVRFERDTPEDFGWLLDEIEATL